MEFKLYETFPLTEYEFLKLMEKTSKLFTPPLSEVIDIEEYSHKLYSRASFSVCWEVGKIKAFTAFYKNQEARQLYVSLICVAEDFQHRGLGRRMLDMLASLKKESFSSIGLEVVKTNKKAYTFYKNYGFVEQEDRGLKLLMQKKL